MIHLGRNLTRLIAALREGAGVLNGSRFELDNLVLFVNENYISVHIFGDAPSECIFQSGDGDLYHHFAKVFAARQKRDELALIASF